MSKTDKGEEYFLRLEAYFPKGLRNYWSLILESLRELSRHVSTAFRTEVYEDFNVVLFHEEELENFLHASIHFSKIREIELIDSIVDKVLESSEFVEVYLSVKDDALFQKIGENIYVEGINVRILKYGEKGLCTLSYRLFKQNKGICLIHRILSKASRKRVFEEFKRILRFKGK
ncbi:MAG: hypothetical protein QXS51_06425 [Thermoproteota archaeon]|nr:hypothetical protein [Candidatus Brockarchaeota archaeon]